MDKPKLYGPYAHRGGFRFLIVQGQERTATPSAPTEERARQIAEAFLRKLVQPQVLTVEIILDQYSDYLSLMNKPTSVATAMYRLQTLIPQRALPIKRLTARHCEDAYMELVKRQKPDTHRNALAEARTFVRWLLKRGLVESDPLVKIEPMGRRKKGKPQLHLDEARRWLSVAEKLAREGHDGAVAAMVTLLMGLRATEIIERVVRDLDDGGRLLWIPSSKTEAGRRQMEVPEVLRPYLLKLKRSKLPTAKLFGDHWRDWPRRWVEKICKLSGVPKVNAHSMRGLFATLGIQAGAAPHVVAATLGHESPTVTLSNYAQPGSAEIAPAHRAVAALTES